MPRGASGCARASVRGIRRAVASMVWSVMLRLLRGEQAEPGGDAQLEREEDDELGEGDDAVGRPSGVGERDEGGGRRLARAEHEQVRVLERGGEPIAERGRAGRRRAAKRERRRRSRRRAVRRRGIARRARCVRAPSARSAIASASAIAARVACECGVVGGGHLVVVQQRDELGDGRALGTGRVRLVDVGEEGVVARLGVVARGRAVPAQGVDAPPGRTPASRSMRSVMWMGSLRS